MGQTLSSIALVLLGIAIVLASIVNLLQDAKIDSLAKKVEVLSVMVEEESPED
jgi:hypothetical protein